MCRLPEGPGGRSGSGFRAGRRCTLPAGQLAKGGGEWLRFPSWAIMRCLRSADRGVRNAQCGVRPADVYGARRARPASVCGAGRCLRSAECGSSADCRLRRRPMSAECGVRSFVLFRQAVLSRQARLGVALVSDPGHMHIARSAALRRDGVRSAERGTG